MLGHMGWLQLMIGVILAAPLVFVVKDTPLNHPIVFLIAGIGLAYLVMVVWVKARHGRDASVSFTDPDEEWRRQQLLERRRALAAEREAQRSQATPSPSEPRLPSGPSSP